MQIYGYKNEYMHDVIYIINYNNPTREDRSALYNLKNEKSFYKSAAKGSAVVVCDRDGYIKEAEKQFGDNDILQ